MSFHSDANNASATTVNSLAISSALAVSAGDAIIATMWSGYPFTVITLSDGGAGNSYEYVGAVGSNSVAVTFTAAPSGTSATLTSAWTNSTGLTALTFSDGEVRLATFTDTSTAVTWSGALTGSPTTSATALVSGSFLPFWVAQNCAAGSTTITVSQSSGTTIQAIYAQSRSGLAASGQLVLATAFNYQSGPGSEGANILTSGTVAPTFSKNADLFGFCWDNGAQQTPVAGTSPTVFTARTSCWQAATGNDELNGATPEDASVTAPVAATFGINTTGGQYDSYLTAAIALAQASVATYPLPSQIYIMP